LKGERASLLVRSLALVLALALALGGCVHLQQGATLAPGQPCAPSVEATWGERPYYDALPDAAARAKLDVTGFGVAPSLATLDPGMIARYGVYSVDGVEYREGLDSIDLTSARGPPGQQLEVSAVVLGTDAGRFAQLVDAMGLPASVATDLASHASSGGVGDPASPARFATATLATAPDLTAAFQAALRDEGFALDASSGSTALRDGAWTFVLHFPTRVVQDGAFTLQTDPHGFTSGVLRGSTRGDALEAAANATFAKLGLDAPTFSGIKGGSGCASF